MKRCGHPRLRNVVAVVVVVVAVAAAVVVAVVAAAVVVAAVVVIAVVVAAAAVVVAVVVVAVVVIAVVVAAAVVVVAVVAAAVVVIAVVVAAAVASVAIPPKAPTSPIAALARGITFQHAHTPKSKPKSPLQSQHILYQECVFLSLISGYTFGTRSTCPAVFSRSNSSSMTMWSMPRATHAAMRCAPTMLRGCTKKEFGAEKTIAAWRAQT
eukprot:208178-Rhodomonas_salina.1